MRTAPSTLRQLAEALRTGATTSVALVEGCLARIAAGDPAVFTHVDAPRALAEATAWDARRRQGSLPSPFAGIPFSAKDLFDVAGEVTTAGSVVLRSGPPAGQDAEAVRRMRQAGFVLLGRGNMTEFAFSGLGLNPHFGTPRNVADRALQRVPGGSSSGAAVAVGEAMSFVALGTDTGGSCRIPAALNGLVGYKPTAARVSQRGVVPLSPSLDSVGPIGASVACCRAVFELLSEQANDTPPPAPEGGLRLLLPSNLVQDDLDETTAERFAAAVATLQARGVHIIVRRIAAFDLLPDLQRNGGIAGCEAFHFHAPRLSDPKQRAAYDPLVLARILRGGAIDSSTYAALLTARTRFIAEMAGEMHGFDALISPATPMVAPPVLGLADDEPRYDATNLRMLRNTSIANVLDGCAISLPTPPHQDALPVGLMLTALAHRDEALFEVAGSVERWLAEESR